MRSKASGQIPVVDKAIVDQVVQAFLPGVSLGIGKLFLGERDCGDLAMVFARGEFSETTPAAADFKDGHTWPEACQFCDLAVLGGLRGFQIILRVLEECAGVCHAAIEEALIEVVADVVVRMNVFACTDYGIPVGPV